MGRNIVGFTGHLVSQLESQDSAPVTSYSPLVVNVYFLFDKWSEQYICTFFSGSISSVFDHNCYFCHRPLSLHVKCLARRGNVAVSGCCKHLEASSDVHSQPSVLLLPLMCSMFAVVSYGCSVEVCCIEYN